MSFVSPYIVLCAVQELRISVVGFQQLLTSRCAENVELEALLRNWSRCARKLVRLSVGRRLQRLQLALFRRVSVRPSAGSGLPVSFHFAPPSSPSNQPQVTEHLLRSRRAIDIFARRTTHRCLDRKPTPAPVIRRSNAAPCDGHCPPLTGVRHNIFLHLLYCLTTSIRQLRLHPSGLFLLPVQIAGALRQTISVIHPSVSTVLSSVG